jgi:hypothetical protein
MWAMIEKFLMWAWSMGVQTVEGAR